MDNLEIGAAFEFARLAHGEQKRKYTGEPYIHHPMEVANIVMGVTQDREVIAAAYLHDVIEDTHFGYTDLLIRFGSRVAKLVQEVTDQSKPSDGNRAKRKAMDRDHLAKASPEAQTIKLADMISNTPSIMAYDRAFAKVYIPEKRLLLGVLSRGDWRLFERATQAVEAAEVSLDGSKEG